MRLSCRELGVWSVERLKDEELKGQVVGRFEGRKVERRKSLQCSVLAKARLVAAATYLRCATVHQDSAQFSAERGEVSSGERAGSMGREAGSEETGGFHEEL